MNSIQHTFKNDPDLLAIMEQTSIFSKDAEKRVRMANLLLLVLTQ